MQSDLAASLQVYFAGLSAQVANQRGMDLTHARYEVDFDVLADGQEQVLRDMTLTINGSLAVAMEMVDAAAAAGAEVAELPTSE